MSCEPKAAKSPTRLGEGVAQLPSRGLATTGRDGRPRAIPGGCPATGSHGRLRKAMGGPGRAVELGGGGGSTCDVLACVRLGAKRLCPLFFAAWGRQLASRWVLYVVGQKAVPTNLLGATLGSIFGIPSIRNHCFLFLLGSAGQFVGTLVGTWWAH